MLYRTDDAAEIRRETVSLACGLAKEQGQMRTPPWVVVRFTSKRHTTGRCVGKRKIVLSIPKGASVPQVLALICHEVAHWLAPGSGHKEPWREAFRRCLAAYEADPGPLIGTKYNVHTAARQALAERLGLPQAGAVDEEGKEGPVVTGPVDPTKRDAVLRKVANALALAKGASNEHEASTAALVANRLLRAYRLSMEDVSRAERDRQDPHINLYVCQGAKKRVMWRIDLGFGLAHALGCYALSYGGGLCEHPTYERHRTMRVFGRQSSVLVFEHLYTYLLREIDQIGVKATRNYSKQPREVGDETPREWGAGFRLGAVGAVLEKIRQQQEEQDQARANTEVTGLVLCRQDYREAEEYAHSLVERIYRPARMTGGAFSVSGRIAGRKAGQKLRVNTAMSSKSSGPRLLKGS